MARQRNHISRLPADARLVVCELLDAGATYDDVRSDPVIASACERLSLTLHNSSFQAYLQSPEYDEYRRRRRDWGETLERRRVAAALLDDSEGLDALGRVASYELLSAILDKIQAGGELEAKEISALSTALSAQQRKAASDREDALKLEVERLRSVVADLTRAGSAGRGGLSEETIAKIEEQAGLL